MYSRNLPGIALLIAVFAPDTGSAGPPFRTDDPVPVEPQHWKICLFWTGTHAAGGTAGHRWDSSRKLGFAPDSPLEGRVTSELVSGNPDF